MVIMVPLTAWFWFCTLTTGIHGYSIEFRASIDGWEPISTVSPDEFSTEQIVSIENEDSSSSTEHLVTLDPNPSVRPLEDSYYPGVRDRVILMANDDYTSRKVFAFFNQPSELRAFIDGVFYSLDRYRKEVKGVATLSEEISTYKTHSRGIDKLNKVTEQTTTDHEIYAAEASTAAEHEGKSMEASIEDQYVTENILEFADIDPSVTAYDTPDEQNIEGNEIYDAVAAAIAAESVSEDFVEEIGAEFNSKVEALRRSGVLVEVVKGVDSQIVQTPLEAMEGPIDEQYVTENILEFSDFNPPVTTYDTPADIHQDTNKVHPEMSHGAEHFTKDWSKTRFPPVKTKIVVSPKNGDATNEQSHHDSVLKLHNPKSKSSDQAAYIASRAVEGSLRLAETIARETAYLVNRITMDVLKRNLEKSKVTDGHLKHRTPTAKFHDLEETYE